MTDAAVGDEAVLPALVPDVPVALTKLVRRILCGNPSKMTGPGTNTYLIGIDEVAVIDPGPDDADHLDAIAAAGSGQIRWILCTHTHPDHSPGAAGLKARTGAEVLAFADTDGLVCDRHLVDGDTVEGTEFTLRAVHTPGHASNHLCFLLERDRLLFTGDHVMDASTVVISPPDGDMAQYLASIERLQAWTPRLKVLAPAHGHLIDDPAAKLAEYHAHRLAREAQVLTVLAGHGAAGAGTAALVEEIYAEVAEELHPVARKSVWAHLRKLAHEGSVTASDVEDPEATWVAR
ncbi:MBL fold metallo-hydrolase [Aquihabitans sp. G128]|uniref:MBL fold metallo-hydrolase n=1 Tax=Aquihabitans sp. G128 TaxID=2849779 RepID=UPI001C24B3D8|nr:MBL fold metallo-hydrolase [Aquihabitans sp. G128]QXC60075.1 MBL fold metallo-hydrolase [Aquihabitans sp. G128]